MYVEEFTFHYYYYGLKCLAMNAMRHHNHMWLHENYIHLSVVFCQLLVLFCFPFFLTFSILIRSHTHTFLSTFVWRQMSLNFSVHLQIKSPTKHSNRRESFTRWLHWIIMSVAFALPTHNIRAVFHSFTCTLRQLKAFDVWNPVKKIINLSNDFFVGICAKEMGQRIEKTSFHE